jgi:hypothetical protein
MKAEEKISVDEALLIAWSLLIICASLTVIAVPARLEKSQHFNHFQAGRQFIKQHHLLILAR